MNRYILASLLAALSAGCAQIPPQNIVGQANTEACGACLETPLTADAARENPPRGWLLQKEHEPVFDSDILVAQAGMEHAQTVLLVHGTSQIGFTEWAGVIPHFARRYHVLALDLPGFGDSDSPVGEYSPAKYAGVLSWLVKRHAKGPVIVIGHSMGGAVALRFAGSYPEQVRKLILVAPAGILHRTAYVKQLASLPFSVEKSPVFLKRPVAAINGLHGQMIEYMFDLPDVFHLLSEHEDAWGVFMFGHANFNAGLALAQEDFSDAIYSLRVPTHIIWGDQDAIAPLRTAWMLARRISRAELHIMPGAGHIPMEGETRPAFEALLYTVADAEPKPAVLGNGAASETDLHCKDEVDKTYSGHYREVLIEDCTAVRLRDINAAHVVIRNSVVALTDAQIHANKLALEVSDSDLIATAGEISGEAGILADNSRIDMAGFKLATRGHAVEVKRSSRLIGSANAIRSPEYTGYWQGYDVIEKAVLSP